MLALAAAYLIAFQKAGGPYPDRAKFLQALKALPDRAPQAEVLKALGKPDRVEHLGFSTVVNGQTFEEETWLYGTDGPTGAATLARFEIYDGKLAYHPVFADPPSTGVISESELRKGMHLILDSMPTDRDSENKGISVWVVKATNALLPFGEAKCKAIVGECGRIIESYSQLNPVPYFLCYSLFDPPRPPGYFDGNGPVWTVEEPPQDRLAYPRWPVEIVNNAPVIHGQPMGGFGGIAPSFGATFAQLRDRIHLRKSPLSPPK
jgi:hypothetical protein